jgi:ABC-2 type transport system ATP-binding protein
MLLRAISGLINLDSGSIFIDGEKLHDKIEFPPETGIVIENMELLPECSAKRNLQMLAKIKNIADEKLRRLDNRCWRPEELSRTDCLPSRME